MSYFLADSTGPLTEFASIGGYHDFREWAKGQSAPIRRFVHFGFTEDLKPLTEALKGSHAPGAIEALKLLLQSTAEDAQDILVVSDGMSDDSESFKAAEEAQETLVHKAAVAFERRYEVACAYAFAAGRAAIKHQDLLSAKTIEEADRACAHASFAMRAAFSDVLPSLQEKCLDAGGAAGLLILQGRTELRTAAKRTVQVHEDDFHKLRFDIKNPKVVKWGRKHLATLLDDLTLTTQHDIAEAILYGHETGDLRGQYKQILAAVGDKDRAQLISRNETMVLVSQGQRLAWAQAVDKGLLAEGTKRVWITADLGACALCEALDGETATLDGEYDNGGGDGPPRHVICRCTEGIVP